MRNIFVSYRRDDSADVTDRIYDHLKTRFGKAQVFKDVDSIPSGMDFREVIKSAVEGCDVFLAVIGSNWLKVTSATGSRRIDDPNDFVRLEVCTALERKIPVIPVLVNGTAMPAEADLPEPLRQLAFQNAISVRRDPDFPGDIKRLCRDLDGYLNIPFWRRHTRVLAILAAALLFVILGVVALSRSKDATPYPLVNELIVINNVTVIMEEYEKYRGKPASADLKQQIDQALGTTVDGKHRIKLLEKIAAEAPLPSIFTNLGVEYAKLKDLEASKSAFDKAIKKDPNYKAALQNRELLEAIPIQILAEKAIKVEPASVASINIDRIQISPEGVKEIQVVKSGEFPSRLYEVEHHIKPESLVIVNPGTYDIVIQSAEDGKFALAKGVQVKQAELVRINPNILLGAILVEPPTRKGYPAISKIQVLKAGTKGEGWILQQASKLDAPLPIVQGNYDILGQTAEGDHFTLQMNLEVKAGGVTKIQTDKDVAAVVVHPIGTAQIEAIRVFQAGGDAIVAETSKFDRVMFVPAGGTYDVTVKQAGSKRATLKTITPKRGELIELP